MGRGSLGSDLAPAIVRAVNVTKQAVVAERVEWAGTSRDRRRGLLGRTSLAPGHALYLAPCQWIHMFGMRFPIDVAFLAGDGKVLAVHESLRPNRISRLVWTAAGVLELPATTLAATGTRPGDRITFERETLPG